MSKFIEFTTSHNERTYGNPVHDGRLPSRLGDTAGIRVDGEILTFEDDSIPERVRHYLRESKHLRRWRIANDCVAFVSLMESIELEGPTHNLFAGFDSDVVVDRHRNTDRISGPVVLARGFHDEIRRPAHVVLPAHLVGAPNFLHKLGDKGPLCMSSLSDAMSIMDCTTAHPVVAENS